MKKSLVKTGKTKEEAIEKALKEINKTEDQVEVEVLENESSGFLGLIGQKDAVVRVTYEEDLNDNIKEFINSIDEQTHDELEEEFNVEEISKTYEKELEDSENLEEITKENPIVDLENKEVEDIEEDFEENQKTDKAVELYYKAKDLYENILKQMHYEDVVVTGNLEDNIIKLDAKIDPQDTGIAIGKKASTLDAIELIMRKSIKARSNDIKLNIDINNYKKRRDDKIIELADIAAKKVLRNKKYWNLKFMNSYERRLAHEQISKYNNLESHSEGEEPRRYVVVEYKED